MSEHTEMDPFRPLDSNVVALNGHHHPAALKSVEADETWQPMSPGDAPIPAPAKLFHPAYGNAVARWVYRDAAGKTLFLIARFDTDQVGKTGKPKKEFLPYRWGRRIWTTKDGKQRDVTGWHCKPAPTPRPPYAQELLADHPNATVLLVEGERTANAVVERFPDFVGSCIPGGANAVRQADWSVFKGRHVVIWPDRDDAGQRFATEAARALRKAGAKSVRIVQVPQSWPEGWDVADPNPPGVSDELLTELLAEAEDADPPTLPENFRFTDGGLFFYPEGEDTQRVFVSAAFDVIGEANDGAGMDWGVVIRWQDRDDRRHQWSVPQRLVHSDGNGIAEDLAAAGLHIGTGGRSRSLLKQFIAGVRSKRRMVCVDRTGWHQCHGASVFILPGGEAYGPAAGSVILQTDRAGTDGAFQTADCLSVWQDQVARYAVGNDRLLLAISAAFTAPLLDVANGESGGVHFVGKSRSGKSTLAFAAGSVWGKGAFGAQVRQWRATANGLESVASETSDTVLILDEIGQSNANDVADTVYMLANGSGKTRASKEGGARRARTWRTTFISTGEVTLAQKMSEVGKKMMAGLEARMMNIAADAGAGMGVFQALHDQKGPADLSKHLTLACRAHFGTAGRAYLTRLSRDRARDEKGLAARIKKIQTEFVARHVAEDAAGQVRNVADRFALMGAAGELARSYDILPWPKGEALRAAGECFKSWLAERGGAGASEDEQALAQVAAFIEAHGESRFTPLLGKLDGNEAPPEPVIRTHQRAGWRRRIPREPDGWEYLILPQAWRNEVCKGLDPKLVAEVLKRQGLLLGGTSRHPAPLVHIPSEGSIRVYRVSGAVLGQGDPEGGEEVED